jgi:excisionase family DNA binding protein
MTTKLLKAREVAAILGIGESTVYRLLAERRLPIVHIGDAVRVPEAALAAWIEERIEMPLRAVSDEVLPSDRLHAKRSQVSA